MKDKTPVDELILSAMEAGEKAGTNCKPIPFVVEPDMISINGKRIMTKRHVIKEGRSGEAWVILPADTLVGITLVERGIATIDNRNPANVIYTVNLFDQRHAKIKAYAEEFAKVLIEAGIDAKAYDMGG